MAQLDVVEVGRVEEFPAGACRIVNVHGREIGVINSRGRFYAVLNYCPHRGGPVCAGRLGGTMMPTEPGTLEYAMEGQVLQCPWHGWEFNIETGETMFSISRSRLKTYPVSVQDGHVRLRIARGEDESSRDVRV